MGVDGMGRLPLIHALRPTAPDDALGVAEEDVARLETDRLDEIEAGDARGARAAGDDEQGDLGRGRVERAGEEEALA